MAKLHDKKSKVPPKSQEAIQIEYGHIRKNEKNKQKGIHQPRKVHAVYTITLISNLWV